MKVRWSALILQRLFRSIYRATWRRLNLWKLIKLSAVSANLCLTRSRFDSCFDHDPVIYQDNGQRIHLWCVFTAGHGWSRVVTSSTSGKFSADRMTKESFRFSQRIVCCVSDGSSATNPICIMAVGFSEEDSQIRLIS